MFDRYNTVDEDDTRKAVNQLEKFFENVDQNTSPSANVDQNVDQNEKSDKNKIG
ncbi:MAG: hypothetical protein V3S16_07020 [Candidatus Desulfatibia sp.]|jgi:hypothetical protein|uniref:hypothetical protein n=1 Tax=Candidatus Desulfatibia sp. TaxID=3101189 RepID=UPI002F34D2E9